MDKAYKNYQYYIGHDTAINSIEKTAEPIRQ